MSMTPQLFSLSGLAVELRQDRRTVAKKLRGVAPDGELPGGHRGWFLATALREIDPPRRSYQSAPPPPEGFEYLAGQNPVDQAAALALRLVVERMGALAAAMVVGAGGEMKIAFVVKDMMTVAAVQEAERIAGMMGLPALRFDPTAFADANWQALAEAAGEEVDLPAWETWKRERCGGADG
jgi:hypothetical protein